MRTKSGRSLSDFDLLAVAAKRIIEEDQKEDVQEIIREKKRVSDFSEAHKKIPFEYCHIIHCYCYIVQIVEETKFFYSS